MWLWIAIEPIDKIILLGIGIFIERRTILVVADDQFMQTLATEYANIQSILVVMVLGIHKHVDFLKL